MHCSVHFIPLHHHAFWRHDNPGDTSARHLPVLEALFPRIVSLPFHPALSDDDVDYVCTHIAELARCSSTTSGRI